MPATSLDNLVSFGIKWVNFDPIPTDENYFSLMVAKAGLVAGKRIEHAIADTRDETSLSRAFYLAKQPDRRSIFYLSPVWPFRLKSTNMLVKLQLL